MEFNIILLLLFGMGAGVAIGYLTALLRYNKSTPDEQKAQLQLKMALAQTISLEKNLKEFGDKVSEQEKNAIENDIKALKEAVASDDTDKIKSGLEALTQSSMKLGEAMYKAQQQDAPNPNEPSDNTAAGSDQNNEKVVDAEFEEVKEDNKQS